jgi:hypothetical protein
VADRWNAIDESFLLMCGISFTLHGWRPSSFFRVADRWDARLMTAVCWFVGSLSRLVILDTCPRIDFFANLSIGYLCFVGRMFPLIIHDCMVVACLGILYYFHVCIFTRCVTSLVTFDI